MLKGMKGCQETKDDGHLGSDLGMRRRLACVVHGYINPTLK